MPFTSRGKEQEHNLISSFQLYCMRRRHFFFIFSGLELFYDSCCAKLNEMDFSMLPLYCKLFHRILTSHPFNFDTVGILCFTLLSKNKNNIQCLWKIRPSSELIFQMSNKHVCVFFINLQKLYLIWKYPYSNAFWQGLFDIF